MLLLIMVLMVIYHLQQPDARIRHTKPIPWAYAIVSMGYVVFWTALRSGFADTRAYIFMFESTPVGLNYVAEEFAKGGKSPGFAISQILFKTFFSEDFHWWLATLAISSGLPIMLTLRRKSVDYLFSMYLFVASTYFIWMSNGARQFLVAAILFGFYFLLVQRKRVAFIIIVLLCSYIHSTCLIMLPAVFFIDLKPFGKMMMLFTLAILLSTFFVGPMLGAMDTVLQDTSYHGNLDQFAQDDGAHPLRVLLESVPMIMAFIKRKQIAALKNDFINLCINMSTVAAGIFYIAMLTSGIMIGRLPLYFSLYNFILIPFLIYHVYSEQRRLWYFLFFSVYLAFYFYSSQNHYYVSDILGSYF